MLDKKCATKVPQVSLVFLKGYNMETKFYEIQLTYENHAPKFRPFQFSNDLVKGCLVLKELVHAKTLVGPRLMQDPLTSPKLPN
jgi:hypothetical protein